MRGIVIVLTAVGLVIGLAACGSDGGGAVSNSTGELSGSRTGVTGRVTDAATGAPVAVASVTPAAKDGRPMSGEAGVTDNEGRYVWTLAPGEFDINVSSAGYQPATKSVTVVRGQLVTLDFALTKSG